MVDKLYIMLPEFRVSKGVNWRKLENHILANPGFKKWGRDRVRMTLDMIQSNRITFEEGSPEMAIFDYYTDNKEAFIETKINKLEYDYSKPAHEQKSYRGDNGKARRNNAIIDMIWSVLTNENIAPEMLTPGSFVKQKTAARITTILDSMSEKSLKSEGYTYEDLLTLPLKFSKEEKEKRKREGKPTLALEDLASRYKKPLNPLSPRTQVIVHQQNMTGAKMITVYAVHSASHAIMQHTSLGINGDKSFIFAGRKELSLHEMKNKKGELISGGISNFLAASVDNVKDNTLHATNQNTFTGDVSMLLARLGYSPMEIAVLMRQPIIMHITSKFFREHRENKSVDTIIDEVISSTSKYAKMYENLTYNAVKANSFDILPMMKDIMIFKDITTMSEKNRVDFYRRQVAIGLLFKRMMESADALRKLTGATRADTPKSAAGPSMADTVVKLYNVRKLLDSIENGEFPLDGADVLKQIPISPTLAEDTTSLRKRILESPLPFLQAFYSLGMGSVPMLFKKYFPQLSQPFIDVIYSKYSYDGTLEWPGISAFSVTDNLSVNTINSIYNDLLVYIMSKTEFFGAGPDKHGRVVSAFKKRKSFINDFPEYFNKVVRENEDIADFELIKRLKPSMATNKNPVRAIVFKNVGRLSTTLKERYMRDWTALLYSKNPKARELAFDLFKYAYFRNGFAFGPNTFIHLSSSIIRQAIPEYIPTLRGLLHNRDNYMEFVEQYIYNHLDNKELVKEIPDTTSIKFTEEGDDSKVKDEVEVSIYEDSPKEDMVFVKEIFRINGTPMYQLHSFISSRINGKNYYYKYTDRRNNTAIYTRIEPLGFKNNFLEYEYGKFVEEMETAIDVNKKGYDPYADLKSQSMDRGLTEEDLESMPDFSEAYSEQALPSIADIAYEQVYGESLQTGIDENDITSIEPNQDFRDANDEDICGSIIVAKL